MGLGIDGISATSHKQYIKLFHKVCAGAIEYEGLMQGFNFGKILANKVPKCYRGKIHVF